MDRFIKDELLERTGFRRNGARPTSPAVAKAVAQAGRRGGRETPHVFLAREYPVSDTYANGEPA